MLELASLISRHARYRPDATAVVFEDERLDYRAFRSRVARVGNALRSLGIGPGDKVATVAGNSLELLETYWAVPTIGATLVPLSPMLLGPGLASLVRGSDARCVVAHASMVPALGVDPRRAAVAGAGVRRGRRRLCGLRRAVRRAVRCARARARRQRGSVQHHVHQRHHRAAEGDRALALRALDVLHADGLGVPDDPGVAHPARRRASSSTAPS